MYDIINTNDGIIFVYIKNWLLFWYDNKELL